MSGLPIHLVSDALELGLWILSRANALAFLASNRVDTRNRLNQMPVQSFESRYTVARLLFESALIFKFQPLNDRFAAFRGDRPIRRRVMSAPRLVSQLLNLRTGVKLHTFRERSVFRLHYLVHPFETHGHTPDLSQW